LNKRLWNRDELDQALRLYCLTPFGRMHSRNREIIELGKKLNRTANAVALKLVNFASLDPTIPRKGMGNVSNLDKEVWNSFFEKLSSSQVTETIAYEGFAETNYGEFEFENIRGLDLPTNSTRRINQGFFRRLILASYDNKCALSGMTAPELLVAGHIVPWNREPALRTDPRNGICLNSLFDRAFDRGLITFDKNFRVKFSSKLPTETIHKMKDMGSETLIFPSRFRPGQEHFEYHRDSVFHP